MAKKQTFVDKTAKVAAYAEKVKCEACKQESVASYAKFVESKVSEKTGAWKFLERKVKLCGNCGTMIA
ncbi:hypothetical protein L6Q79_02350 [bacterium]|nr:hypothetical protein [bacterium]NUN45084.1 hypothetical protein [bacterium]HMV25640.1 hypothetical protein [bacterium]HMW32418.1 hypothetical protein [bacterium]HMW34713.1 hypothetical protein [bacterium]